MGRAPDFIGVGVQKAGTSWLAACLNEHPQVRIPIKETGFFTDWYEVGVERYGEKLGEGTMSWQVVGEFSTKYFHVPGTAERIWMSFPFAKILVVLRNPVDRFESVWKHQRMRGRVVDFEQAFEWSKYADRLEEWLKWFPEMKVVLYESLVGRPEYWIRELYRWLGVETEFRPGILRVRVNRSIGVRSTWAMKRLDGLGKLRYWVGFKWFWWDPWFVKFRDWVKRWNQGEEFGFNDFERRVAWGMFEEDVKRVELMIGKTGWGWWHGFENEK